MDPNQPGNAMPQNTNGSPEIDVPIAHNRTAGQLNVEPPRQAPSAYSRDYTDDAFANKDWDLAAPTRPQPAIPQRPPAPTLPRPAASPVVARPMPSPNPAPVYQAPPIPPAALVATVPQTQSSAPYSSAPQNPVPSAAPAAPQQVAAPVTMPPSTPVTPPPAAQPQAPTFMQPPTPYAGQQTSVPTQPAQSLPPSPPPAVPINTQPSGTPLPAYMLPPSSQPKVASATAPSASVTYPAPQQPLQASPNPPAPAHFPLPVSAPAAAQPAPSYQPTIQHLSPEIAARLGESQNSGEVTTALHHNQRVGRLKGFLSFTAFITGIFFAAFLINQFIFQSYYVEGTSMTPTLQNDDRLIIDKVERTAAHAQGKPYLPKRGDIVVLDSTIVGVNGQNEQLIKRVIGLPGDTIIINNGTVIIKNAANPDGFSPDENLGLHLLPTHTDAPIEYPVPENHVYVMGDNRAPNGSYDSRAFGSIETDKLVGKLWARILPLDKAQTF